MATRNFMQIDPERLEKTKQEIKSLYEKIVKVHCPYLNEDVNFNSNGFAHLLSKSWQSGRTSIEQYQRLRLLPRAVDIIKKSHFVQEHDVVKIFVRTSSNNQWNKTLKNVTYYAFIAVFYQAGLRVKVVVKQIEGGRPFFWSIYPCWRTEKDNVGNIKKVFYSGNLELD